MSLLKTYCDSDSPDIPKKPGVYLFYLNAINRRALGLLGNAPFDEGKLNEARLNLKRRLKSIANFLTSINLEGYLKETDRAEHLGKSLKLVGSYDSNFELINSIDKIPAEDLPIFIKTCENLAVLMQPIYVGITYEQTLFERFRQHRNNYTCKVEGTFGGRLKESGFEWVDIIYSCTAFNKTDMQRSSLEQLENYLQYYSKPMLSHS